MYVTQIFQHSSICRLHFDSSLVPFVDLRSYPVTMFTVCENLFNLENTIVSFHSIFCSHLPLGIIRFLSPLTPANVSTSFILEIWCTLALKHVYRRFLTKEALRALLFLNKCMQLFNFVLLGFCFPQLTGHIPRKEMRLAE